MRVAIFDFDGTIYKNETFQLMMDHLKNHPTMSGYDKFYRSIVPVYAAYKVKLCPEAWMKANLMKKYLQTFAGMTDRDIFQFFAEVKTDVMHHLNEEVVKRLKQHADDQVYTMVVSGAYTSFLNATIADLPFDRRIGTEIPFHDGILPKRFSLKHMQGKHKTAAIYDALGDRKIDWENSFAYGDSFSDIEFMHLVGNPVAVDPDERLQLHAKHNGWEVLHDNPKVGESE